MEVKLRIPGNDEYSFVEVSLDDSRMNDPKYVKEVYESYYGAMHTIQIDERFDAILIAYIKDPKTMNEETYKSLTPTQQHTISTIKRARA